MDPGILQKYDDLDEAPQIFRDKLSEAEQQVYLKLTMKEIEDFHEIFDHFDTGGNGTIDEGEISLVMQGLGQNPTPEKIKEMINEIDYDNDGEVDFHEFICLMVKTLVEADKAEEELVQVFRQFDRNADGVIDAYDLQMQFRDLGFECDQDKAHNMINFFDRDADGQINFAEFVQIMMYDTEDPDIQDYD